MTNLPSLLNNMTDHFICNYVVDVVQILIAKLHPISTLFYHGVRQFLVSSKCFQHLHG